MKQNDVIEKVVPYLKKDKSGALYVTEKSLYEMARHPEDVPKIAKILKTVDIEVKTNKLKIVDIEEKTNTLEASTTIPTRQKTSENINLEKIKNEVKKYLKRDNEGFYISSIDLLKIENFGENKLLIEQFLKDNKIRIMEQILKQDRPSTVEKFHYGSITEAKHNPIDTPLYAKIEYDENGEIISENYEQLIEYLEDVFIPNNLEFTKLKGASYEEPYPAIQLNKLVKEKFSEDEISFILDYLKESEIMIRGTSEDLEGVENYDFHYSRTKKNTHSLPPISSEETIKYFIELKKCKDADGNIINQDEYKKIVDKIADGNARFAEWVLYKFNKKHNYYFNFQEWKSVAYEGLFMAIEKFDVDRGYKFSSFAYPVIYRYLKREVAIYYGVPINAFSLFWSAMKVIEEEFGEKYVRGKNKEMDADLMDLLYNSFSMTETAIKKFLYYESEFIEDHVNDAGENIDEYSLTYTLDDFYSQIDADYLKENINEILDTLTERETLILKMTYGLDGYSPMTQKEIGKVFGISDTRVHQIQCKALRKLRHPSRSRRIRDFIKKN